MKTKSRGFRGWVTHYSICDKHIELNLPSIALRLSLGLNQLRLNIIIYMGISSAFGLHDFPLFHRAVKLSRTKWSCYFPMENSSCLFKLSLVWFFFAKQHKPPLQKGGLGDR